MMNEISISDTDLDAFTWRFTPVSGPRYRFLAAISLLRTTPIRRDRGDCVIATVVPQV